ncbi:hypothetical protein, partial [Acetobacter indonesiensis]
MLQVQTLGYSLALAARHLRQPQVSLSCEHSLVSIKGCFYGLCHVMWVAGVRGNIQMRVAKRVVHCM